MDWQHNKWEVKERLDKVCPAQFETSQLTQLVHGPVGLIDSMRNCFVFGMGTMMLPRSV